MTEPEVLSARVSNNSDNVSVSFQSGVTLAAERTRL